jgi:peptidoglycan/LPS O-acetylase OafA/YrhL
MKPKSIYFPGLNGIRFLAAAAVMINHIEGFKKRGNITNVDKFTDFMGHEGVTVFFVLSGFLITYLLLEELKQKGEIKIKNFYLRRILRIWPLYFLIFGLGYFVFPNYWYPDFFENPKDSGFTQKALLNIFFLPNLVFYGIGSYFSTSILWSIGVEEQFYIFWPWFIKKWNSLKNILIFLILFIGIRYCFYILSLFNWNDSITNFFKIGYLFLQHDSILIGGLFAFLFHIKHSVLKIIYLPMIQIIAYLAPIVSVILSKGLGIDWIFLASPLHSVCYSLIIVNISTNTKSLLKLENNVLNYLGKISFGLYMYHSILIFAVMTIFKHFNLDYSIPLQMLFYLLVFGLTILTASISYKYFEKPVLRYKSNFMSIKSSSNRT